MLIRMTAGALAAALLAFTVPPARAADGKALFEEHCAVCHIPAADLGHDDFVAPPMFGVMRNYRRAYPDDARAGEQLEGCSRLPQRLACRHRGGDGEIERAAAFDHGDQIGASDQFSRA